MPVELNVFDFIEGSAKKACDDLKDKLEKMGYKVSVVVMARDPKHHSIVHAVASTEDNKIIVAKRLCDVALFLTDNPTTQGEEHVH